IAINQHKYALDILSETGILDCRPMIIIIQKITTLKTHHPPPRTQEPEPTKATSHNNDNTPKDGDRVVEETDGR
ncbi:hypothetical protein A2U01_0056227, partial [Trifolium medium]|nr:hypothetical protein [Trifolium medium]